MKMPLVSIGPKNRSAPVSATHLLMISLTREVLFLHSLSVWPVYPSMAVLPKSQTGALSGISPSNTATQRSLDSILTVVLSPG